MSHPKAEKRAPAADGLVGPLVPQGRIVTFMRHRSICGCYVDGGLRCPRGCFFFGSPDIDQRFDLHSGLAFEAGRVPCLMVFPLPSTKPRSSPWRGLAFLIAHTPNTSWAAPAGSGTTNQSNQNARRVVRSVSCRPTFQSRNGSDGPIRRKGACIVGGTIPIYLSQRPTVWCATARDRL